MHLFTVSTVFVTLLTLASSLHLPKNAPDGVYHLSLLSNGTEIHTRSEFPTLAGPAPLPRRSISRRAVPWPQDARAECRYPRLLASHNDFYNIAYNQFWSECAAKGNTKITTYPRALVVKRGESMAYMCNYSQKDVFGNGGNPCSVGEWAESVERVRDACRNAPSGFIQAGWFTIPSWKKSYGYDHSNTDIC